LGYSNAAILANFLRFVKIFDEIQNILVNPQLFIARSERKSSLRQMSRLILATGYGKKSDSHSMAVTFGAVIPKLLSRILLERRFDDLLDAWGNTGGIGMQTFHQQGAVVDLLNDQVLQI
jgi:hypothetical protein